MVSTYAPIAKSKAGKRHQRGGCKIGPSSRTERNPEKREHWKVNPKN